MQNIQRDSPEASPRQNKFVPSLSEATHNWVACPQTDLQMSRLQCTWTIPRQEKRCSLLRPVVLGEKASSITSNRNRQTGAPWGPPSLPVTMTLPGPPTVAKISTWTNAFTSFI